MSIVNGIADRGRPSLFTVEKIAKLRKLYCAGVTYQKIGEELGMRAGTVRNFVRANASKLGLVKRRERIHNPKTFDKEWYGLVPRGHWSICKPWGSKRYYEELRDAERKGRAVTITW